MKISSVLVGLLMVSLIIAGVSFIGLEGANTLGNSIEAGQNSELFNKTQDLATQIQTTAEGSDLSLTFADIPIIGGAWRVASLFFKVADLMRTAISDALSMLGVPSFISAIVMTMIGVTITFSVLSLVFRRDV